nr:divalent-cation tolerance protein CutA [Zoogloeaceae bacterium]
MTDVLAVITNLPDQACAERLAEHLVAERLAACVNILAPCRSIYRWQGTTEHADEIPVLIKTTRASYAAVERAILALHPYELPEIVAVPASLGLGAYLDWVSGEVASPP